MMQPRLRGDRGGVPYQQPVRYTPAEGEVVHVGQHMLFLEPTFVNKMNRWYDKAVNVCRPGDPANAGIPATARDLRSVVMKCVYAPPDTIGLRIDRGRIGFRHEDFPDYIFIAVLEGITSTQPVGRLTFISMVYEQKPPADRAVDMPPLPVPDWPPADCPKTEAITRLDRAKIALDVWINQCPDRHPKLDEAYATRRAVIVETDRLLRLPDDDFFNPSDEDGIFDSEEGR